MCPYTVFSGTLFREKRKAQTEGCRMPPFEKENTPGIQFLPWQALVAPPTQPENLTVHCR